MKLDVWTKLETLFGNHHGLQSQKELLRESCLLPGYSYNHANDLRVLSKPFSETDFGMAVASPSFGIDVVVQCLSYWFPGFSVCVRVRKVCVLLGRAFGDRLLCAPEISAEDWSEKSWATAFRWLPLGTLGLHMSIVVQCSATPASVAATPPCSATPF